MGHAMEMDDLEIARRMAVLREDLAVNDVALWTRNILGDLRDTRSK
jgi:trehalose-6-phosphate synthase